MLIIHEHVESVAVGARSSPQSVRSQSAAELDQVFGYQHGQQSELQVHCTANAAFGNKRPVILVRIE
jgi:hypothetical protein